jgi:hypothetical protein
MYWVVITDIDQAQVNAAASLVLPLFHPAKRPRALANPAYKQNKIQTVPPHKSSTPRPLIVRIMFPDVRELVGVRHSCAKSRERVTLRPRSWVADARGQLRRKLPVMHASHRAHPPQALQETHGLCVGCILRLL